MVRKYSKSNFVEAVKIITPDVYLEQDLAVSGEQIKLTDRIINSHIAGINSISTANDSPIGGQSMFLHLSSIPNSNSYSSIDTPEAFSRFFIKQNKLTDITPQNFEQKILNPLGKKLTSFDTSTEFSVYVSSTLLPKFTLNSSSLYADNSGVYSPTFSGVHDYFITNLNWLYFLNTSGPIVDPSSLVYDALIDKIYGGHTYNLDAAMKDYQTYVWKNYYTGSAYDADTSTYSTVNGLSSLDTDLVPPIFFSGLGTFTSGVQNLEKLKTFIDVIYSPLYIDQDDTTVKDAINLLIDTPYKLTSLEEAGPFHKFLRAYSYVARDLDNEIESLQTLTSIRDCPVEFLPFLASVVGWHLYGTTEISWRNQIANAARLYRKRGTKQGLVEALNTIIVQNPINTSAAATEMYESYIPNLLYYLLKTESPLFNFESYTQEVSQEYGVDFYNPTQMDVNIRACVDTIIKGAVEKFPHLFFIRNEPFRVTVLTNGQGYFGELDYSSQLGGNYLTPGGIPVAILADPNFVFNFRSPNREYPIPPWEEEKFYRNCAVTTDLLNYYSQKLQDFCVPKDYSNAFYDYVNTFTLEGGESSDLYIGNAYVFFTSSQEYAPNQDKILSTYQTSSYDALTLWNGKSSTYDFTVSGGVFSSVYFQDVSGLYTIQQIVDTLRVVDDFTPAKAVPRTRLSLEASEYLSGIEYPCPSVRWPIKDVPITSSVLCNSEVSGVDDRGTNFALGSKVWPGYDDSRSTVTHAGVPAFSRLGASYPNWVVSSCMNTSAVVKEDISRRSLRRRDFYNTLEKKGWHSRDGWSMPSQYNSDSSALVDYMALGFIPSSFSFAPGTPENLSGVYSRDCLTTGSNQTYFGVNVSNTFLVRGNEALAFGTCDPYTRRDITPEEVMLFFNLEEKKKKVLAHAIYKENEMLLNASAAWFNFTDSYANLMDDLSDDKYRGPILDKRKMSIDSLGGIQSVYNDYNQFFLSGVVGSALPEHVATTYIHGGPNILSHVYGPIYKNADFYYDGSAVIQTSSHIINRSLQNPVVLNFALSGDSLSAIGVASYSLSGRGIGPYFGFHEWRSEQLLSGITFIDTSNTFLYQVPKNEFSIYKLAQDQKSEVITDDNYLINNQSVVVKYGSHGLPRITFDLRGVDQLKNILIPEHDFELSVRYLIGDEKVREFGGGNIGVILRTKPEEIDGGEKAFFVWAPDRGDGPKWQMVNCNDVTNGYTGIDTLLEHYTHRFSGGEIETVDIPGCSISTPNSILSRANKSTFQTAKIKFHTRNILTVPPYSYGTHYSTTNSDVYNGRNVQVHRAAIQQTAKTQNYIIEIFPLPSNTEDSFVLFDKINVVDETLNTAARVPYEGNIPDFNKKFDDITQTTFYRSNGNKVDFSPAVIRAGDIFSPDNLLKISSPGNISEWADAPSDRAVFTPWAYDYPSKDFKEGFLRNFPEHEITSNTLWITDIAPYGKIPFTGPVNYSWTTTKKGFELCRMSILDRHAAVSDYWNSRKGFLALEDWSEYIVIGNPTQINAPLEEQGPGNGLTCWLTQNTEGQDVAVRPLLGFTKAGEHYKATPGQLGSFTAIANPMGITPDGDGNGLIDISPNLALASIGQPQEINFTSFRIDDFGTYWNVYDELLPYITDPLGYTPSAIVFKNMINIPKGPTDPAGSEFGWAGSGVWLEEGHGITFPPMSIYRDIDRGKLIHRKNYTFSMYIAHLANIDGGNPASNIPNVDMKEWATSAMLTVAPIGSNSSYTRLTLKFPNTGTAGSEVVTSSIQTAGHALAGNKAARVEVSSVNPLGGAGVAGDDIQWYRMEVTIPYDALELDLGNKPNLGLRCTLQAYNDEWDYGYLPEEAPSNLGFQFIPCKVLAWGAAFQGAGEAAPFTRYANTITGVSRNVHWGYDLGEAAPTQNLETIIYKSNGNIIEKEETILPKEVYLKDQELYLYDKSLSGLGKLTVGKDAADNTFDKTKLYKKIELYDTSGVLYTGKMTLNPNETLLRDKYAGESPSMEQRFLSVSGNTQGTNIVKRIAGSILVNPRELLHMFRFFNKLGKIDTGYGFNTRVLADSSGIHDSSGGSRLSYSLNPDNHLVGIKGRTTTFGNYSKINLNN